MNVILNCLPRGTAVKPDDVIVDDYKLDMTAGNENPLDKVSFYDDVQSTIKRKIEPHKVTNMLPLHFQVC